MRPNVATFRELIQWIAVHKHGGVYSHIADRLGISQSAVDKWKNRDVKSPQLPILMRLATAYDIDFEFIAALVSGTPPPARKRRKPVPIRGASGASVPLPVGASDLHNSPDVTSAVMRKSLNSLRDAMPLIGTWLRRLLCPDTELLLPVGTY